MRSRRLANVAFVSFAMLALPRLVSAQLIPLTVTEPVAWTNLVHVVDDGTSLRKVGGCDGCQDSGAASQQQIVAGDAYAEFVASETTTIRGLGLSHFHAGTSAADLDFAIALWSDGWASVYEDGNWKADLGTYAAGDVFRIAVAGGIVQYSQNGVVGYTSGLLPLYPLQVDAVLLNNGATIADAVISGTAVAASPVWTAIVNATPSANSLQKTSGCDDCQDAGAVSRQTIDSGDGFMSFTAAETTTDRAAGLSHGNTDMSGADLDFAIALWDDGWASIYEGGVYKADLGPYASGDVFRVAVEGGVVNYYQNDRLAYASTNPPSYPLRVDTTLWSAGATIGNVVIAATPQ